MTWTRLHAILSRCRSTLFPCALVLAGCVPSPGGKPAPGPVELATLPPLQAAGSVHYTVDADQSDVRILVYRGGPLAQVGHNHVMRVHDLRGDIYLTEPVNLSGFQMSFPVTALEVDPPAARAEEGRDFATVLSPQAVAATYRNMLGPAVLDAAQYPVVTLRSVAVTGSATAPRVTVRITLHGVSRDLVVPVALDYRAHGLGITGEFELRTSNFGMTPFSVLGGGLTVQDGVRIRASIAARLSPAAPGN